MTTKPRPRDNGDAVPPVDLECEARLIGALILGFDLQSSDAEYDAARTVLADVDSTDLIDPRYQKILTAIRVLAEGGRFDVSELKRQLKRDHPGTAWADVLADAIECAPNALTGPSDADHLRTLAVERAAIDALDLARQRMASGDAAGALDALRDDAARLTAALPGGGGNGESPHLICMADVTPTDIQWLWRGRLPLGRMTLLVGRPGDGKSYLTAYITATVSRGRDWIDATECPRGSVVMCNAEDDPDDTIAPRLLAHGADMKNVHLLAGVTRPGRSGEQAERVFTLADLPMLRQTLERLRDCKLIVVDPIGSYLGGRVDAHRDNEVRGVLAPVCHLAAQFGAALLVVMHTRKSVALFADDMAMGSRAFTGLARSVLHLLIDPDDEKKRRRLLLPGKTNLCERPAGLAFDIRRGVDGHVCIHWHDGEVDVDVDEAVNRAPMKQDDDEGRERGEAENWLRQFLAAGPKPAREVQEHAKEVAGISGRTLERAKKDIRVESYRPENPGPWWWRLPNDANRHDPENWQCGDVAVCPDDSAKADFAPDTGGTSPDRHVAKSSGAVA